MKVTITFQNGLPVIEVETDGIIPAEPKAPKPKAEPKAPKPKAEPKAPVRRRKTAKSGPKVRPEVSIADRQVGVGDEVLILSGRHRPKRVGVLVEDQGTVGIVEIQGYVEGNQVVPYRSKTQHEVPGRQIFPRSALWAETKA